MKIPLTISDTSWLSSFERHYFHGSQCSLKANGIDLRIYPIERESTINEKLPGNVMIKTNDAIIDTGASLVVLPGKLRSQFKNTHTIGMEGTDEEAFLVCVRIQKNTEEPIYVSAFAYFSDEKDIILLGMDFLRSFFFVCDFAQSIGFQLDFISAKPHTGVGNLYKTTI